PDDLRLVSFAEPQDRMFATQAAYSLVQCLFRLCFRLEARGSGHIPSAANFIMTPNHTSYLDGFVAILCLPFGRFRNIYALGLSEFFTGFLRSRLSPVAHVIPIDTASYLNKALQMSAHVLKNNRSLCVFPEGGRSFDGELMEFKKGVGILAKELGAPVVPVYIDGAFEALPRYAFFPRFRKITVFFGPPLRASDLDFSAKPEGMDDYQYFANVLRERVEELRETARKQ
ncbi:MAG: lysophospholipid acyltransferase family protein, partial [Nitrospiraceae bacterium]|nr:lysophospholipid acyltransferase family protein [Nitrospiraceae bacterium]